jgi:peptidoglycan hydrolase-like protein with peptidoglycan-binding domain
MTIGDGHDLESPRFAGDEILEACYDNERFLRRGNSGSAVEKIQQALMDAGFPLPMGGVDGFFGEETELAVKNYQRARGLNADGVIGPVTIGNLDIEFITGVMESTAPQVSEPHMLEPQMSEVPAPLTPKSSAPPARTSPVSHVRAPKVPHVRAPEVPPVHAPPVPQVTVPAVPLAEPPILTTQTVPPEQQPLHLTRPITPPLTRLPDTVDSQGRKFHTAGTLSGNRSFEVEAGKSVRLEVNNLNVSESNIRIKTNTGEVRESVLLPNVLVDFEFSLKGEEPFIWKFYIETENKEFLVNWKIYSNWVPGDSGNP